MTLCAPAPRLIMRLNLRQAPPLRFENGAGMRPLSRRHFLSSAAAAALASGWTGSGRPSHKLRPRNSPISITSSI